MADLLIQHLKNKGQEHSSLALLVNQWGFDEALIPKALQSIANLFPHYSRHDESHSKQILINIERLLGESIRLLTATDTWLLLEAAYWHDIGMVVSQRDLQDALADSDFQEYLDWVGSQPNHELNRFVNCFKAQDISTCFAGADTPIDAINKFRELMAEWFRKKHANRADQIVQSPWDIAGISSPRTELIPQRLFRLLGRICQMHGATFSNVLGSKGLPFREAGLAQEDCHPRFVACLLRMGDLLDMDDNRFCPVMQRIAGEDRPRITKAHEDKHAGMRHLRIDRERIEVIAECETIDGYLEAFKWFEWLKQEMQNQMSNWRDIAPSRELGLLPTLGPIEVRLNGLYEVLQEGEKPTFNIDGEKAIELLQGNNLYDDHFACIRELLQNAIDATLLRIWLSDVSDHQIEKWSNPLHDDVISVMNQREVVVDLIESGAEEGVAAGKSLWTLIIRDQGTGISREDLTYMLKIGGSHRNIHRQMRINEMPEWMKPSGAFGIGLQSAFMLCDVISITTKSIFTNETLNVEMYSPTGSKDGLVLIRTKENDISQQFGTEVKLKFELDTYAKSYSVTSRDPHSIAARFVDSLDPNLDSSFPFEAAVLADQIIGFSENSLVPIKSMLVASDKKFEIDLIKTKVKQNEDPPDWKFVKNANSQLKLWYAPKLSSSPDSIDAFYRGQSFEAARLYFPHVEIGVDLMSGKAGSWLNFSRDKIASSARNGLEETILSALEIEVRKDIDHPESCKLLSPDLRPVYSLFLEAMALQFGTKWIELADRLGDAWLDLSASDDGKTFGDYVRSASFVVGPESSGGESRLAGCDIWVGNDWYDYSLEVLLSHWQKQQGGTIKVLGPSEALGHPRTYDSYESPMANIARIQNDAAIYRVRYQLSSEPQEPFDNAALATELSRAMRYRSGNHRRLLNCSNQWGMLFLKPNTTLNARPLFYVPWHKEHFVLLPFLFKGSGTRSEVQATSEQIKKLSEWVQSHLLNPAPVEKICEEYEKLIDYIDNSIMEASIFSLEWKRARGLKH